MGKFAKGCLITAFILIGIGVVLGTVVSVIAGRSLYDMIGEHGDLMGDWRFRGDNDFSFHFGDEDSFAQEDISEYARAEDRFDSSDIKELYIEAGWCVLDVISWQEEDIGIVITGDTCDYYVSDEGLYIKGIDQDRDMINIDFYDENEITLYIPEDMWFEYVDMQLDGGSFNVEELKADTLVYDVGAGEGNLEDMMIEELYIDVEVGAVVYEGSVTESAEVSCQLGSLSMELEGEEDQYNYTLSCGMGNITLGDRSFSALDGEREFDNDASYDIELDCELGYVDLQFAR